MPVFKFLNNPTPDDIKQITALYLTEGWTDDTEPHDLTLKIILNSYCFMIAVQGNDIVGMGRCISDGVSDAYIQDVAVKETFKGQGIGTEIVSSLVERLRADGLSWIGLIAERGTEEFYHQLGFKKMTDAVPMVMLSI